VGHDHKSAIFHRRPAVSPLTLISPGGRDRATRCGVRVQPKDGRHWHDHEHTIAPRYPALIQIPNDSSP
jgi:hypothetical protein